MTERIIVINPNSTVAVTEDIDRALAPLRFTDGPESGVYCVAPLAPDFCYIDSACYHDGALNITAIRNKPNPPGGPDDDVRVAVTVDVSCCTG